MRDFLPPRLRNFPHLSNVDNLEPDVQDECCKIQFSGPGRVVSVHASCGRDRGQDGSFRSHWLDSLESMPVANVKDLALCNYDPTRSIDRLSALGLFRTMNGVRSLVVERCNNNSIVEAFFPPKKGNILFPHLESLTFPPAAEPTTIFPRLTDMARALCQAGFPLSKVSSDKHTTFRRSHVDSLQCHVSCVRLGTRANSYSSEPVKTPSYNLVTVRILFVSVIIVESPVIDPVVFKNLVSLPKTVGGSRAPDHLSKGGNRGNDGLAKIAALYLRG